MRRRLLLALLALTVLGAGSWVFYTWRRSTQAPTSGSLILLRAERETLRARLLELTSKDPRISAVPQGDVKIGVPVSFAKRLVREVAAGFLNEVSVTLKDLHVDKGGELNVKTFLGPIKAGDWKLTLDVQRVHGVLEPGAAQVTFEGRRVMFGLPVSIASGEGRGRATFSWDSKGVANAICKDFSITENIAGSVLPHTYDVHGGFLLSSRGDGLVASPEFGDIPVHLQVEPSAETWAAIRKAIADQDSFWKCGVALKPDQVEAKLAELFAKGFDVKVPRRIFHEITLPASLETSLPPVDGRVYELRVTPSEITATSGILWYAADVSVAPGAAASPSPTPANR